LIQNSRYKYMNSYYSGKGNFSKFAHKIRKIK